MEDPQVVKKDPTNGLGQAELGSEPCYRHRSQRRENTEALYLTYEPLRRSPARYYKHFVRRALWPYIYVLARGARTKHCLRWAFSSEISRHGKQNTGKRVFSNNIYTSYSANRERRDPIFGLQATGMKPWWAVQAVSLGVRCGSIYIKYALAQPASLKNTGNMPFPAWTRDAMPSRLADAAHARDYCSTNLKTTYSRTTALACIRGGMHFFPCLCQ